MFLWTMNITLLKNSSFKDSNNFFSKYYFNEKDWWRAVWYHKQFNNAIKSPCTLWHIVQNNQKLFYGVWSELQDNQT